MFKTVNNNVKVAGEIDH